jgi:hypothetical protein
LRGPYQVPQKQHCCCRAVFHSILAIWFPLCTFYNHLLCDIAWGVLCPSAVLLSICYGQQFCQFCQERVSRDHEYMWLSQSGVSPAYRKCCTLEHAEAWVPGRLTRSRRNLSLSGASLPSFSNLLLLHLAQVACSMRAVLLLSSAIT